VAPPRTSVDAAAQPLLLTVDQAKDQLSISRAKLFMLLRDGEIHSIKIGSSRRIPIGALTAYVQRLGGNGGAAA